MVTFGDQSAVLRLKRIDPSAEARMKAVQSIVLPQLCDERNRLHGSVLAGFLRSVDHQYIDQRFVRFEFETKLLL